MSDKKSIELTVDRRETGKHFSRKHRREEMTPGIIYGGKVKNTPLVMEEKIVRKYSAMEFENELFTLKSEDKDLNGVKVLMKTIDRNPVTRRPIHVDFFAVDLKKVVRVNVELRYEGKAEGVGDGGVLSPVLRELEVECLPDSIPEAIVVDVTPLKINENLHVSDLTLPDGVVAITAPERTIVNVIDVQEEPEAVAAVAAPVEGAEGEAAPAGDAPAAAEGGEGDKKPDAKKE